MLSSCEPPLPDVDSILRVHPNLLKSPLPPTVSDTSGKPTRFCFILLNNKQMLKIIF
jgi:hypothetical protein